MFFLFWVKLILVQCFPAKRLDVLFYCLRLLILSNKEITFAKNILSNIKYNVYLFPRKINLFLIFPIKKRRPHHDLWSNRSKPETGSQLTKYSFFNRQILDLFQSGLSFSYPHLSIWGSGNRIIRDCQMSPRKTYIP